MLLGNRLQELLEPSEFGSNSAAAVVVDRPSDRDDQWRGAHECVFGGGES